MRNLKYKLNDGTVVNTLTEAKTSGKPFQEILIEERKSKPKAPHAISIR